MVRSKTKKIGEFTYKVQCLDPESAFDLFVDLFQTLVPAIADAAKGLDNVSDLAKGGQLAAVFDNVVKSGGLADGLKTLASALDKTKMKAAMRAFAEVTEVEGVGMLSEVYRTHFTGRFDDQLSWFFFCVYEVQYKDFFGTSAKNVTTTIQPSRA
jgi:hypothetical protein